jgi:hypothetical protein
MSVPAIRRLEENGKHSNNLKRESILKKNVNIYIYIFTGKEQILTFVIIMKMFPL